MYYIDDQLESMLGSRVLTILELTKFYHQMKLHKESKEITALFSPKVLFQWKELPMGIKHLELFFNRL